MSPLEVQLERLRRRWWLVALVVLVAVVVAVIVTLSKQAVYTGKAALTTASQNRSPDQDAFLAQGYAQYFNETSYQDLLRDEAQVPDEVTFSARTAATSPILYIEAVSSDRQVASDTASRLAEVFRDEVRGQLGANKDELVADIDAQIEEVNTRLDQIPVNSDERVIVLQQLFELQARANDVKADDSNQLKDLKLNAGVSASLPNLPVNAALALLGGLMLGSVLVLTLAGLEGRVHTAREVRELVGLDTFGVVGGKKVSVADRTHAEQFKGLANVISLSVPKRPAAIAITTPRASPVAAQTADALAYYQAAQGNETLLMLADLHRRPPSSFGSLRSGVVELLSGASGKQLDEIVVRADGTSLLVVPGGGTRSDPYSLFDASGFTDLVTTARNMSGFVVLEAPPVLDAAESHIICSAANAVVVVVEVGVTRAADFVRSCELLRQIDAKILGVVLARPVGELATPYVDSLTAVELTADPHPEDGTDPVGPAAVESAADTFTLDGPSEPDGVGAKPSDTDAEPSPERNGGEHTLVATAEANGSVRGG